MNIKLKVAITAANYAGWFGASEVYGSSSLAQAIQAGTPDPTGFLYPGGAVDIEVSKDDAILLAKGMYQHFRAAVAAGGSQMQAVYASYFVGCAGQIWFATVQKFGFYNPLA